MPGNQVASHYKTKDQSGFWCLHLPSHLLQDVDLNGHNNNGVWMRLAKFTKEKENKKKMLSLVQDTQTHVARKNEHERGGKEGQQPEI